MVLGPALDYITREIASGKLYESPRRIRSPLRP